MFTGIIEQTGQVVALEERPGGALLRIETPYQSLQGGESIAVSGVCLTVTEWDGASQTASFFLGTETLRRSNLRFLQQNNNVNLERALAVRDARLGGHVVQGHVDGLATLSSITQQGETVYLDFLLPPLFGKYCIEKGSIALNGVSLTVFNIQDLKEGTSISIQIIPETWKKTNLSDLKVGDSVNIEVDVLAKYVERLCQPYFKR